MGYSWFEVDNTKVDQFTVLVCGSSDPSSGHFYRDIVRQASTTLVFEDVVDTDRLIEASLQHKIDFFGTVSYSDNDTYVQASFDGEYQECTANYEMNPTITVGRDGSIDCVGLGECVKYWEIWSKFHEKYKPLGG